ncbi:MAG: DUF3172 domain-containing protein [Leptolyngbyaceae cyanobacterium HOT.MB2.61]|nr:DUF3172 domain-containing protein [Leptolyngbyaceae cyanobacterium HOT.MB2.61]
MKRKSRSSSYNYDRDFDNYDSQDTSPKRKSSKPSLLTATSLAILAGVFILGIGVGMGFSSVATTGGTGKIVTQGALDAQAPNAELCVQFGASAIAMDTRVFVTLNPLNVFVSQPTTRPGCVLRHNNFAVLEQRGLVNSEQVRSCRQRMNTFGFTGTLESSPQIDCVYQNDAARNLFLKDPGAGTVARPENERF